MTYSIRYYPENLDDGIGVQYAIDWNWGMKGMWTRSIREHCGSEWVTIDGLDNEAENAMLEHFGLEGLTSIPRKILISMSWRELGEMRRLYESYHGLERLEMRTQCIGGKECVP